MNIIDLQERLKDFPEQALMQEMQAPSGMAPQFLVLSELKRRKRMRDDFQRAQAADMKTVAEEAITGAGVPQAGIMQMAGAMAPNTNVAQDTGINDAMERTPTQAPQPQPQGIMSMARGGYVKKMQEGGSLSGPPAEFYTDPSIREMARRQGISIEQFWNSLSDEAKAAQMQLYSGRSPSMDRDVTSMPSIADVPALPTMPAMFGGFSIPPEAQPERPALAMRGGEREPRAYTPETSMGIDALLNTNNMGLDFDATYGASDTFDLPEGMQSEIARAAAEAAQAAPRRSLGERALAGRLAMDTSDVAALRNRQAPAPSIDDVMAQFGVSAEEAQAIIDRTYGPRQGGEGSSFVITEAAPPGTPPAESTTLADLSPFLPGQFAPFFGSQEEYEAALAAQEAERLNAEAAAVTPEGADTVPESPAIAPAPRDDRAPPGTYTGTGIVPSVATPTAPLADRTTPDGGGVAGGAGGAGGVGGFGPIESRIAQMLQEREQSAAADKWLALAQTGLALMASRQPTLGGAIGEAGLAGIGAMRQARSQYDKDVLGLLEMQAGIQRAKASGARATTPKATSPSEINAALDYLSGVADRQATVVSVNELGQEVTTKDYSRVSPAVASQIKQLEDQYMALLRGGSVDLNLVQ